MTTLGTQIIARESAPPRSAPVDTGVWFVAGMTEKGSAGAVLVTSLTEFERQLGGRVSYGFLYDAAEAFFREGGGKMYVSRVFGPAPVTAFVDLNDSVPAATLRVSAKSPGDWGNLLNVAVIAGDAGGEFKLVISHDTDGVLETSPSLADTTAAIAWASTSDYVRASELAGTGDPAVVSAQSLATGTDDHTSATDGTWLNALNQFTKDLGPGQVSMPGRTTDTAHTQLLAHAEANNRLAIMDAPDTSSTATLKTSASALRTLDTARYGGLFAPWATIPGITPGTTRTIPYSAIQAGLMARNDAAGLTANEPAAGIGGVSRFALGLTQSYTDADRNDLADAGVNTAIMKYGQVRTYGYRTLVNALVDDSWIELSNSRLYMQIAARADAIAERYVFAQIDGRRRKIAQFGGELTGMLVPLYEAGALYGDTPDEAFFVDVGAQVNTDESLSNRQLKAVLSVRMSPFAELVTIEIVKVGTTEAVA